MTHIFLAGIIFLSALSCTAAPIFPVSQTTASVQATSAPIFLFLQPESLDDGDKTALKPFEGFTVLSIIGMVLIIALLGFVILKVMRGMNRKN